MPFNLPRYASIPPYQIQTSDLFDPAQCDSLFLTFQFLSPNNLITPIIYAQILEMILSHLLIGNIEIQKLASEFKLCILFWTY